MAAVKIIFLIAFSTQASEYENQPCPRFSWTKPDGGMIGIWGLEWGELLVNALVKQYPEYDCEVWKPELGADKVYSAQLRDRLVSRKFPASLRTERKLRKAAGDLYSQSIIDQIRELDDGTTVFMLPITKRDAWLDDAVKSISKGRILYYNFLNSGLLLHGRISTLNPRKVGAIWISNRIKHRWMKRVEYLLTSDDNGPALDALKIKYPGIHFSFFKMGMDFDFWVPVVPKNVARDNLGIPKERFVILLSQRLVPEYQVDKFIEVLDRLARDHEFLCYISGHGSREYEQYLARLVEKYSLGDRVRFIGFVSDESLREYLIAADLFVTVPLRFAGSGGALKATAVGTPVLHVRSGNSYQFLKSCGAGEYVEPTSYDEWLQKLRAILGGLQVKTAERSKLVEYYDWRSTANELHAALQGMR